MQAPGLLAARFSLCWSRQQVCPPCGSPCACMPATWEGRAVGGRGAGQQQADWLILAIASPGRITSRQAMEGPWSTEPSGERLLAQQVSAGAGRCLRRWPARADHPLLQIKDPATNSCRRRETGRGQTRSVKRLQGWPTQHQKNSVRPKPRTI